MIMVAAVALALASVPVFGGRFRRLVDVDLQQTGLILVALSLQTLIISVFDRRLPGLWAGVLHVTSYGCAVAFVRANRHLRGLWLTRLGAVLNLAPILANGGVMPADPTAIRQAGLPAAAGFANSQALPHPQLAFLGDVFALPARFPLANVFSYGDVALAAGLVVVLHHATESRLLADRRPNAAVGPRA